MLKKRFRMGFGWEGRPPSPAVSHVIRLALQLPAVTTRRSATRRSFELFGGARLRLPGPRGLGFLPW